MTASNPALRAPGRPLQSMQVREDLIHHARLLFIAQPYEKVSLRKVALNAEVNMAMIRYYFNNKAGLFETMLRETLSPLHRLMEQTHVSDEVNKEINLLLALMTQFYQVMSKHKNFPRLISRTMQLSKDAEPRVIVEKIMLEHLPIMQNKIKTELNSEQVLQTGVSPQFSYFSMLNLVIFPFIAPPEILKLHGITIDDDFLSNLLEHNIRLLKQGIMN
ncbi:MAG: TetR/AcrR family transcriptional regulator [Oleispira sp.]|nr:TetR/AcrR family transcriptional regulator [Oleispira sp.]